MTELLFCASTVQWSFTALRRGRTREWERQRQTERERESVCARRVGRKPAHPTLTAACLQSEECCISWGQCRGQGGRGSFLLRSPYSKCRAGMQKTESLRRTQKLRGTETPRERETDGQIHRERETDELQHSARCICCPMFSTKIQLRIIRGQKWEWIIFTLRKMRPRISLSSLDCPLTVLWLDVFVCSLFKGYCSRQLHVF